MRLQPDRAGRTELALVRFDRAENFHLQLAVPIDQLAAQNDHRDYRHQRPRPPQPADRSLRRQDRHQPQAEAGGCAEFQHRLDRRTQPPRLWVTARGDLRVEQAHRGDVAPDRHQRSQRHQNQCNPHPQLQDLRGKPPGAQPVLYQRKQLAGKNHEAGHKQHTDAHLDETAAAQLPQEVLCPALLQSGEPAVIDA